MKMIDANSTKNFIWRYKHQRFSAKVYPKNYNEAAAYVVRRSFAGSDSALIWKARAEFLSTLDLLLGWMWH